MRFRVKIKKKEDIQVGCYEMLSQKIHHELVELKRAERYGDESEK